MNITSKDGCWSVREVLTELFRQRHALSHKWSSSCGRRHLTEAADGRRGFCYGEIVAVASTVVVVIGAGSSWYHCSAAHLFFSVWDASSRVVRPTSKVGLPSPVRHHWRCPSRHSQERVACMSPNPATLTAKINCIGYGENKARYSGI